MKLSCSRPPNPCSARKRATGRRNRLLLRYRMVVLIWGLVIGHTLYFPVLAQVSVLTYHNDNSRTGLNPNETLLTPANVNTNSFGKLFVYNVDGLIYAQPLYVSGLNIPGQGSHNVLFVATEHNTVYALDADRNTGAANGVLWQANLGPSAATPNNDFGLRYGGFETIVPEVGITGTPVIDLDSGTLYVDAFTHEGSAYYHKLHELNLTNGVERSFSPVLVTASVSGAGVGGSNGVVRFEAKQQLQRCALTLAGGVLYAAYAGYDDSNPYHGWIIGFSAPGLQPLSNHVFVSTPNASVAAFGTNAGEGGIWMSGCGLSVDGATNLFLAVGNGSFNALNSSRGTEYGDSFLRLSTSGGLAVADYFTPYNQQFLADNNLDVGSGGLLLLPDQPGPYPHLLVGGGKQARLYLMNRDLMTGGNNHYNATGTTDSVLQTVPLGGGVFSTPAYFNGKIYTAAVTDVMASFFITNGLIRLDNYQAGPRTFAYPGATPSISANGTNNGIVWAIQRSNPALLVAYNATNLTSEIYDSSRASGGRDQLGNGVKFAVPTVANGKVYVGGQYTLAVFGLLGAATPSDTWRLAHFGTNATNPSIAGDLADPDGDRIINILEYAFASDPNGADTHAPVRGTVVSGYFQLQFKRNTSASDLTFTIEAGNLAVGPWTKLVTYTAPTGWVTNNARVTISESAPAGSAPDQYVTVTATENMPAGTTGRSFFRVAVRPN